MSSCFYLWWSCDMLCPISTSMWCSKRTFPFHFELMLMCFQICCCIFCMLLLCFLICSFLLFLCCCFFFLLCFCTYRPLKVIQYLIMWIGRTDIFPYFHNILLSVGKMTCETNLDIKQMFSHFRSRYFTSRCLLKVICWFPVPLRLQKEDFVLPCVPGATIWLNFIQSKFWLQPITPCTERRSR